MMKPKFYVAIIVREASLTSRASLVASARSDNDWSAFYGTSQSAVIEQATRFKNSFPNGNGRNYQIMVGELTHLVDVPVNYKLVKL